jgi:hypothetical protein
LQPDELPAQRGGGIDTAQAYGTPPRLVETTVSVNGARKSSMAMRVVPLDQVTRRDQITPIVDTYAADLSEVIVN